MRFIKLLRPHQWTKNLLCLAGAIFGPQFNMGTIKLGIFTVLVFSAGSSSMYILNDILDQEYDRQHPIKRVRPIASGAVSVPVAAVLGIVLGVGALASALVLDVSTLICLVLYMVNNVVYSTHMKHLALFDVLSIAFSFVMRLLSGIYVLGDIPTAWIVLCTFFLSLFLGFAKRRAELHSLAENENLQRPILSKYTVPYLDFLINSSATMTLLCYALFTVLSGKNPTLIATLPIVYYAIMHYKRMVIIFEIGEEPDMILLKNRRIIISILIWLATYFAIIARDIQLFR